MTTQATAPSTTAHTVYTAWYNAPRADQRLKAGERTFFQASSIEEARDRIALRGIDAREHNLIVLAEHFTTSSYTTDETGSFSA